MKRLMTVPTLLVVVLASLALLTSACGKTTPAAATVNGWSLSRQDFMDELDLVANNQDYLKARGITASPFSSEQENGYTSDFILTFLNERITFQLMSDEVSNRGLTVSAQDKAKAEQQLVQALDPSAQSQPQGSAPSSSAAGLVVLNSLGSYKDVLIQGVADLNAVRTDLTSEPVPEEDLRAAYDQYQSQFTNQACVSHILIHAGSGTPDPTTGAPAKGTDEDYAKALVTANEIEAQLAAGGDFATIAKEKSQDTGSAPNGGDLGCAAKGSFAPEFDDAVWSLEVGTISAPVKTDFGYHIIKVTKRGDLTFEEARPQLEQALGNSSQRFQKWLLDTSKAADVTVDPRFGDWDSEQGLAVAPPGAETPSTTGSDTGPTGPDGSVVTVPEGASTPSSTP